MAFISRQPVHPRTKRQRIRQASREIERLFNEPEDFQDTAILEVYQYVNQIECLDNSSNSADNLQSVATIEQHYDSQSSWHYDDIGQEHVFGDTFLEDIEVGSYYSDLSPVESEDDLSSVCENDLSY